MRPVPWTYDDGGRADAGFPGRAGDCVVRAVAIATGRPYRVVHADLSRLLRVYVGGTPELHALLTDDERTPEKGVFRDVFTPYLRSLGWLWVSTRSRAMCLGNSRIPPGKLMVQVPGHLMAVINGVVHDTYPPTPYLGLHVGGFFWEPFVRPTIDRRPVSASIEATGVPRRLRLVG